MEHSQGLYGIALALGSTDVGRVEFAVAQRRSLRFGRHRKCYPLSNLGASVLDRIRQWFLDHDDGEFTVPPRSHPFTVVPARSASHGVLYTTKPGGVLTLFSLCVPENPCGLIGRCGLPHDADIAWLQSTSEGRPLIFLGDADPPDLLVFGWLRSRIDILYRGLSDLLLERSGVVLTDSVLIDQSVAESAAMSLLTEQVPDFADLVGHECAAVLASGRKIEVEALISSATVESPAIVDALIG